MAIISFTVPTDMYKQIDADMKLTISKRVYTLKTIRTNHGTSFTASCTEQNVMDAIKAKRGLKRLNIIADVITK